jgi:hypothetical protein
MKSDAALSSKSRQDNVLPGCAYCSMTGWFQCLSRLRRQESLQDQELTAPGEVIDVWSGCLTVMSVSMSARPTKSSSETLAFGIAAWSFVNK